MFDRKNVAVRFSKLEPQQLEKDEIEHGLAKVNCEINPLTAELAAEIDEFMKSTLFTRNSSEVSPKMQGASFNLSLLPQKITVRSAPDTSDPLFVILEAKVDSVHVARTKLSNAWTLKFSLLFEPASEHQLAQVWACHTKTRYLTFVEARPDLFSEIGKEQAKTAKAERAQGIGPVSDGARAH